MKKGSIWVFLAIISFAVGIFACFKNSFAQDSTMTAEKLVAEHLKALGNPTVVSELQSRVLNGLAAVKFIQGATGNIPGGQFLLVSDRRRVGLVMLFGTREYPKEYIAYDGNKVTVAHIDPGQRSPLADFFFRFQAPLKEGLLGGVLSAAWPFLEIDKRKPTLKLSEAKIEGQTLYEIEYRPQKNIGDMKIKLYFDPQTFRHVRTVYSIRTKADLTAWRGDLIMGGSVPAEGDSKWPRATIHENVPDSFYTLVEKFDNFREIGGYTLPYGYSIEYSIEGSGQSFIAQWNMIAEGKFTHNGTIDPQFYNAQR